MPDTALETWISSQAGDRLGLTAERVRQLAREGRVTCVRTPLGRLYDPLAVERLRAERAAAHEQGERTW